MGASVWRNFRWRAKWRMKVNSTAPAMIAYGIDWNSVWTSIWFLFECSHSLLPADDLPDAHAEVPFHHHHFAAGDDAVVHDNLDRFGNRPVQFDDRAGGEFQHIF